MRIIVLPQLRQSRLLPSGLPTEVLAPLSFAVASYQVTHLAVFGLIVLTVVKEKHLGRSEL